MGLSVSVQNRNIWGGFSSQNGTQVDVWHQIQFDTLNIGERGKGFQIGGHACPQPFPQSIHPIAVPSAKYGVQERVEKAVEVVEGPGDVIEMLVDRPPKGTPMIFISQDDEPCSLEVIRKPADHKAANDAN